METNSNEEVGLFKKRFSHRQVFDCRRDPLFPKKGEGEMFTVSALTAPYNTISEPARIPESELENKIFYFEGVKGDNDSIQKLSLWMADDENKTNPKCIAENGAVLGLHPENFLYECDVKIGPAILGGGYGYYVSVTKEYDHHDDVRVTWPPQIEKVERFTLLERYPFKEKV